MLLAARLSESRSEAHGGIFELQHSMAQTLQSKGILVVQRILDTFIPFEKMTTAAETDVGGFDGHGILDGTTKGDVTTTVGSVLKSVRRLLPTVPPRLKQGAQSPSLRRGHFGETSRWHSLTPRTGQDRGASKRSTRRSTITAE